MTLQNRSTEDVPEPQRRDALDVQSRLEVLETSSGGRTVAVAFLRVTVETTAAALEVFIPPDGGAEIRCPACNCPSSIPPGRVAFRRSSARPHSAISIPIEAWF